MDRQFLRRADEAAEPLEDLRGLSPTSRIRTRRGRTRFCGGPLNQRVHTLLLFESASSRSPGRSDSRTLLKDLR